MTIGKRLYVNFGVLLVNALALFIINFIALERQQCARENSQHALELAQAWDRLRYQMMQNRLDLRNYLLSGDEHDSQKVNAGINQLAQLLDAASNQSAAEQQRGLLIRLRGIETNWENNFAYPLMEQRKQVNAGATTISELQLFDLQMDNTTARWVKDSDELFDSQEKITYG